MGERFPRNATNIIVALTALAWVIAAVSGQAERVAYALGFVPLRMTVTVITADLTLAESVPALSGQVERSRQELSAAHLRAAELARELGRTGAAGTPEPR